MNPPFVLQQGNLYGLPVIHYSFEMAIEVRLAFEAIQPTCIAVELPETMQQEMVDAAARLPDISIVRALSSATSPLYYLCEPCDSSFEALRLGLEHDLPISCIDLDVEGYPQISESLPDPYAIQRIGLRKYYELYLSEASGVRTVLDERRELHMARQLKELSLRYERVLFVGGMFHLLRIFEEVKKSHFPLFEHAQRADVGLFTLSDKSCREVMATAGWFTRTYEQWRSHPEKSPPDRQRALYQLYKASRTGYLKETGLNLEGYHLRNTMKFARNCAHLRRQLLPDLYQIVQAAKGCVNDNYAYQVWEQATAYPPLRNIDNIPALDLSAEELWGHSKRIQFRPKQIKRKGAQPLPDDKSRRPFQFNPPSPFCICSHPPEDLRIERFGQFLRNKGTRLLSEEAARVLPFTTSLEDGVDVRETIRNYHTGQLFVRINGRPPGPTGAVVVIFDLDAPEDGLPYQEEYPWCVTWHGEHEQESDMAFYATRMTDCPIGPGIALCQYGGFMMSYPPRRLYDIWVDSEYDLCRNKAERLLMAAIDYAVDPAIVYVAAAPPRRYFKEYASKLGKRVVYLPIGQLSPIELAKMRRFHVLDGHDTRSIADEYIR